MSLEERIKFAEQKRDEAFSDGTLQDLSYWNGYLAALKAVKDDGASIIVNNFGNGKQIKNEGHITINLRKEQK